MGESFLKLTQPSEEHLIEMMSWFSNEDELSEWSGPNFRYPFDLKSFTEDLKLNSINSFALVSNQSEFLAFGQYYRRLEKCHLGRLVVNPNYRGKGVALELMKQLCGLGRKDLKVEEYSLFVLDHNKSAIAAYEKFGFEFAKYPKELNLENCQYMIRSKIN